ncbi:MAG TPA: hypothetical protein VFB08_02195 [Burkholderiales bacterium]|nr:hypothetical protein [Burkholderiales bacterium]
MKKSAGKNKDVASTPPLPQNIGDAAVREIWRLYNQARRGKMDVQKCCRLTYMLTAMVKAHEHGELERRVRSLEAHGSAGA